MHWYDKHYVKGGGKLNLTFFLILSLLDVIIIQLLADLVFQQPGYTSGT